MAFSPHEGVLVERTAGSKALRYVAVVLTKTPSGRGIRHGSSIVDDLIVPLDDLVVANNP